MLVWKIMYVIFLKAIVIRFPCYIKYENFFDINEETTGRV